MTQFDTVAISSFASTMLGFIISVSFFLHARTNVTNYICKATRILGVAVLTAELKLLRALSGARLQVASFALTSEAASSADLMENFSFFLKTNFTGSVVGFFVLMGYFFVFFNFCRAAASSILAAIFQRLGFRVMSGLELVYSKVSVVYFSIFVTIILSNLFGLIPFSYTITSGLSVPLAGGIISFVMTIGILCLTSGFFAVGGLLPVGTNKKIAPLVVIIETLSFFAKFASLIIRLFANLFAGHLLLKVLYVGIFVLSTVLSFMSIGAEIISFSFVSAVLSLETILAVLQALVFLALALIYFKDARQFVYGH